MSKIELLLLIVFLLLLILLFKYLQTKRQIRNLSKQIAELVNGKSEKMLDISLIDKDLEQLAGILNQYNDNQRQLIASTLRHENYLKESIANISHDLRTPLTVILGHLQLLRKEPLTDRQAQRIETIFKVSKGKKEIEILPEGNTEAKVVFDHVTLAYENAGENTLTDIDFIVNSGDTIGIIGGTGSGKTSLVHLIPGFYPVKQGAVYVDGKNVKSYEEGELRDKIGIVMQKSVLFKGTIRENMLWGNENATDEEIIQAIETAQGKDILEKKENGLDEEIEQGGRNLSGGQKQRLCIARALVRKPEILILDDSASALDYATDAALRKSLKNLSYHPTTFIVSQRTSSIMHADKIIVLDDGHMVGIGTHEELLQTSSVYKEIYDSQFKKDSGKEAVS